MHDLEAAPLANVRPANDLKVGRPQTSFAESSDRTKRRKTEHLREDCSTEELSYATKISLRSSGAASAAEVVSDITSTSPTRAHKYITAMKKVSKVETTMTIDTVLALVLNGKLTKSQYINIPKTTKSCNSKAFPPYTTVLEAKKRCYPSNILISETCAEVQLQSLLNHTGTRILEIQNDVLDRMDEHVLGNLMLVVKWGFDGSSERKEYKQRFSEGSIDSNALLTSLVPVKLSGFDKDKNAETVIWKNPRPSPPSY